MPHSEHSTHESPEPPHGLEWGSAVLRRGSLGRAALRRWSSALGQGTGESLLVCAGVVVFGLGWAAVEHIFGAASAYDGAAVDAPEEALPSAARWLVDGYNVLHVGLLGGEDRQDWWRATSRQRVIERARAFRQTQPGEVEVWVAFDGSRPADGDGVVCEGVHTVFAESADEWLVRQVKSAEDPAWLAVVTADRRVRDRVRHRGAHVVSPRAFLAGCGGRADTS